MPRGIYQHQRRRIEDRFWEKVQKTDGCWIWRGWRTRSGHGRLAQGPAGMSARPAHQVSWELHYGGHPCLRGPIPKGVHALHRCDNPPCVRPDHLFLGNQSENNRDAARKGRQVSGYAIARRKMTADQVAQIRARYAAGDGSMASLATEYGVSKGAIQHVIERRNWRRC